MMNSAGTNTMASDRVSIRSNTDPQDDFRWSDATFGPDDILTKFDKDMPVLVNITNGIFGSNEIDIISASQMVCIYGVIKQKRMLAIDRRGRLLTIPADYPIKFQVIGKKRKRSKPKRLKDLLDSYNLPVSVTFTNKSKWKFKIGFRTYDSKAFGRFDILQPYVEQYFVGYTLVNGELDKKITLIPCYLDLKMKVAKGLKLGSSLAWNNHQKVYKDAAKKLNLEKIKGPKDILIMEEKRLFENGSRDTLTRMIGQNGQAGLLSMLAVILKRQGTDGMSDVGSTIGNTESERAFSETNGYGPMFTLPMGKSQQLAIKKGQLQQQQREETSWKNLTGDEHVTRIFLGENTQTLKVTSSDSLDVKGGGGGGGGRWDGQYATLDEFKPRGVLKRNTRLSSSTGNIYGTAGRSKQGIYWGPSSASEYGTTGRAVSEYGTAGRAVSESGGRSMKYGTLFISADGNSSDFGTYGDIQSVRRKPMFSKVEGGEVMSDTEARRSMTLPPRPSRQHHHAAAGFRSMGRHRYSIRLADPGYLSEPDMRPEDAHARPRKARFARSNSYHEMDYRSAATTHQAAHHRAHYSQSLPREALTSRGGGRRFQHDAGHYEALDDYDRRRGGHGGHGGGGGEGRRRLVSMNEWKEGRLLVRINEEEDERKPLKSVLTSPSAARRQRRVVDRYEDYYSEGDEDEDEETSYYEESETPYEESETPYETESYMEDDYDDEQSERGHLPPPKRVDVTINDRNNNRVPLLPKRNIDSNWQMKTPTETLRDTDKKDATYSGTVLIHSGDLPPQQRPSPPNPGTQWNNSRHEVFHAGEDVRTPPGGQEENRQQMRLSIISSHSTILNSSMSSFDYHYGQGGDEGWIELDEGQTLYTAPPNDDDLTQDTDHDSEQFYGRPRADDSGTKLDPRTARSYNVIKIGAEDEDIKIETVQDGDSSSSAGRDSEYDREGHDISLGSIKKDKEEAVELRQRASQVELATSHLEELDAMLRASLTDDKISEIETPGAVIDAPAWPGPPVETRDIEDMAISDISPREQSVLSQRSSQSRGQEEAMSISDTQVELNANTNNNNESPRKVGDTTTSMAETTNQREGKPVQRSTGSFVMRSSTGLTPTPSREGTLTRPDNSKTGGPGASTARSVDNWASAAFSPRKMGKTAATQHHKSLDVTKF